jgi:hypothetical protein
MTGNFSVIKEGSTLIKDHATAVQTLEDILAFTDLDAAKKLAAATLNAIGEPGYESPPVSGHGVDADHLTKR